LNRLAPFNAHFVSGAPYEHPNHPGQTPRVFLQQDKNNHQPGNNFITNMGRRNPAAAAQQVPTGAQVQTRRQKLAATANVEEPVEENQVQVHQNEEDVGPPPLGPPQNQEELDQEDDQDSDDDSESEEEPQVVAKQKPVMFAGKAWKIPHTSDDRRKQIIVVVERMEKYRTKLNKATKTNQQLELENAQLKEELLKVTTELGKYKKNDVTIATLKKVVDAKLFPLFKFITCRKKEKELATYIYRWILEDEKGRKLEKGEVNEAHMARWVKTYGSEVTTYLNKARGDCTQRMLNEWKNLVKGNTNRFYGKNKFPTLAELKKCALRQIDMENERERDIYEWYITLLFCKLVLKYGQTPHYFGMDRIVSPPHCSVFSSPGDCMQTVAKRIVVRADSNGRREHKFSPGHRETTQSPTFSAQHGGLYYCQLRQ
jgi:regulator of replication initiation timing